MPISDNQPQKVAVRSSNVATLNHDGNRTLTVEFNNGAVYEYEGVSRSVFEALVSASSVGRALQQMVIGRYPTVRLN